ncbi:MFS transporter [Nonomuraea jiangxiensis]|uniref:Predicted arabinose efflux permease, MFS family n=1 Tax=Nonomuraea jiangxiensis TaxID=633440 RepID=A0A1G8QSK7_9ACTN|nr:MFS transporter [Nonomuraea jiangxiensis]SDJ07687.1 Predicted arabinose efflux permease, MFS family [Nonomuraea jiangxiensis]
MTRLPLLWTGAGFLSLGLLVPAIPGHVTGPLGQGPGMVGACLAITSVCALLARPFAGRLADRRGRRAAVCAGAALLAAASAAVLLADSLPLFLTCRAVAGAGEALMYVGLAAAASDHDRPGQSINRFSVAVNAGLLAGPPLAEAVRSAAGLPAVWALSAAAAVAVLVAGLFPGSVTAKAFASGTPSRAETAGDSPSRTRTADRTASRAGTATPLVHRAGLLPGLAYWASVWGYTAFSAFLPLHVAALGGGGSGTHFLLYGCVLLAVRIGGERLLSRVHPRGTAAAALLLTAAGLIMLAVWPTVTGALVAAAVLGTGQALGLPAFLTMAVAGLPAEQRGSAVATTTAFFDLGFLTAALALGFVAQSFGLAHGFAVAGCVAALAPLLFLARHRQAHDKSPQGDDDHDHSRR